MSRQPGTLREDKEGRKGIKYQGHIRRVWREGLAQLKSLTGRGKLSQTAKKTTFTLERGDQEENKTTL